MPDRHRSNPKSAGVPFGHAKPPPPAANLSQIKQPRARACQQGPMCSAIAASSNEWICPGIFANCLVPTENLIARISVKRSSLLEKDAPRLYVSETRAPCDLWFGATEQSDQALFHDRDPAGNDLVASP